MIRNRFRALLAASLLVALMAGSAHAQLVSYDYRIYDNRPQLQESGNTLTISKAVSEIKQYSPVMAELDKEIRFSAGKLYYRYTPIERNSIGYHSNRYAPFDSPEAACRAEMSDDNYAGMEPYPLTPTCTKCYACYCYSNPGNICGTVFPICPFGGGTSLIEVPTYPFYYLYRYPPYGNNICKSSAYAEVRWTDINPLRNLGDMCSLSEGNPVNIALGNKHQSETDIAGTGFDPSLIRFYNSYTDPLSAIGTPTFGQYWISNYERRLHLFNPDTVMALRADGKVYLFINDGFSYAQQARAGYRLEPFVDPTDGTDKWRMITSNNFTEIYDSSGRLLSITNLQEQKQTLTYNPAGQLEGVTGTSGRSIAFTYDPQGRVKTATDANGSLYTYNYESNGNLSSVIFPDSTPGISSDNPGRLYHYEDANYPHALTGITDESGDRYATWTYDTQGRAKSSEHAGGADKVTLVYNADGTTTVTDALNNVRTYTFETINGVVKIKGLNRE